MALLCIVYLPISRWPRSIMGIAVFHILRSRVSMGRRGGRGEESSEKIRVVFEQVPLSDSSFERRT